MIRDPRRWRKIRVISLATLATLLLVSVALLGLGVRQLVHLGRPATYRLNLLMDTEPNRQVLARRIAAEARKRGLVLELSPHAATRRRRERLHTRDRVNRCAPALPVHPPGSQPADSASAFEAAHRA